LAGVEQFEFLILSFIISFSFLIYCMKIFFFWVFLLALMLIHAVDMELTTYYIGNNWENESFPLMKQTIKLVGISNAIWISRVITYIFFFICYINRKRENVVFLMFIITFLYYTSMICWIFTLKLAEWPFTN
jgi:hypothetical protein